MKTKITIDLPTREKFIAGLSPRDLHPPLARAEEVAAKAEQALDKARRDLADRERLVAELPARIHRGEERAGRLTEAIRERDAAALLVPPAIGALDKARARVVAEEKNAQAAVERELERRHEVLERAASDLAPVLNELRELAHALAKAQSATAWPCSSDWPCCPACDAGKRVLSAG